MKSIVLFPRVDLRTFVSGILAAAISWSANAADLPTPRGPYPTAPAIVQQIYDWTGIYVGVNGGYGWGKQDPYDIISDRFDRFSTSISGGVVGGTIGAQVQVKHVVLGLEADLDWANVNGSVTAPATTAGVLVGGPFNANTHINWESTARLRVGYANNNWLFYGTGGLALLGAKTALTPIAGGTPCTGFVFNSCTGANRQLGAVIGGGLEYGFTPEISAKVEYLYIIAASLDISRHSEIRAGLNYRFGM